MHRGKTNFETSLVLSFSAQPKKLYSQLKRLKSTKSLPQFLKLDDAHLFDDSRKANALNSFFNSTFTTSHFRLLPTCEMPTPTTQLHEISFNSLEIYSTLSKLDTTKAMGPDNLHPHLLKLCADKIYDPITCLFNYIMNTQLIPQEWKIHLCLVFYPKACIRQDHRFCQTQNIF